jgi:S-adenosylmethionine:tRNA ribosyltransferase-isomerase
VINTSGTLPAALPATRSDGTKLELHLSTHLPGDLWTVELRTFSDQATKSFRENLEGETLALPDGANVRILAPWLPTGDS